MVNVKSGLTPAWRARLARVTTARRLLAVAAGSSIVALTVGSAILAKEAGRAPALAGVRQVILDPSALDHDSYNARPEPREADEEPSSSVTRVQWLEVSPEPDMLEASEVIGSSTLARTEWRPTAGAVRAAVEKPVVLADPAADRPKGWERFADDPTIRWFNGRPVRPARKMWMEVTGYSPDARSCGIYADGKTATLHSVTTNDARLVAADPTVLPYGSLVTVPGYDNQNIVPVLDCGGAIKGRKLDLLYHTHEQAVRWGRQRLLVTVWEYADGKPATNPRKVR